MADIERQRCLVLVVEDHEDTRFLLQDIFRNAGYDVELAADGASGLARVSAGRLPDLVILDLGLPDIDGLQVLWRLRTDSRTRQTAVLVFTAHGEGGRAEQARQAANVALLVKPASPQRLLQTAREVLTGQDRTGDSSGSWRRPVLERKPPVDVP